MKSRVYNCMVSEMKNGVLEFVVFKKPKSHADVFRWYREYTPYNDNVYVMHLFAKKYESLEEVLKENLI